MRIVALVRSPDHVCARYRVAAFRSIFERAGHQLTLQTLPKRWLTPWSLSRDVALADVVIVQRRLLSPWQLFLLRRQARRLVYDFDDAVFLRDSYHPRGPHSPRRARRFAAIVRAADAVVAGNSWLADQASRWTSSNRVHVIPTCIDLREYSLQPPNAISLPEGTVRLVWIGSSSTLQGMQRVQPMLEQLGATYPNLRLQMICDSALDLNALPVDYRPWSPETEARDLADADIGISWVPDDPWSRGKCGLKVLQYMAAGLPVVANPVGVQSDLIEPHVTGFQAETPEAWIESVGKLARDVTLRRRLGRVGRRRVEEQYSVEVGGQLWLDVLASLTPSSSTGNRKTK